MPKKKASGIRGIALTHSRLTNRKPLKSAGPLTQKVRKSPANWAHLMRIGSLKNHTLQRKIQSLLISPR
jgi:hypothetical protein